jgi:hypothetical protein
VEPAGGIATAGATLAAAVSAATSAAASVAVSAGVSVAAAAAATVEVSELEGAGTAVGAAVGRVVGAAVGVGVGAGVWAWLGLAEMVAVAEALALGLEAAGQELVGTARPRVKGTAAPYGTRISDAGISLVVKALSPYVW